MEKYISDRHAIESNIIAIKSLILECSQSLMIIDLQLYLLIKKISEVHQDIQESNSHLKIINEEILNSIDIIRRCKSQIRHISNQ